MDDKTGTVIGKIAHIHARKIGGPRFDAQQTDEERRSFDNLLLLCGPHHDAVDNMECVEAFPAELLRRWKKEHEKTRAQSIWKPPKGAINEALKGYAAIHVTSNAPSVAVASDHSQVAGTINNIHTHSATEAKELLEYRTRTLALKELQNVVRDILRPRKTHPQMDWYEACEYFASDHVALGARVSAVLMEHEHVLPDIVVKPLKRAFDLAEDLRFEVLPETNVTDDGVRMASELSDCVDESVSRLRSLLGLRNVAEARPESKSLRKVRELAENLDLRPSLPSNEAHNRIITYAADLNAADLERLMGSESWHERRAVFILLAEQLRNHLFTGSDEQLQALYSRGLSDAFEPIRRSAAKSALWGRTQRESLRPVLNEALAVEASRSVRRSLVRVSFGLA